MFCLSGNIYNAIVCSRMLNVSSQIIDICLYWIKIPIHENIICNKTSNSVIYESQYVSQYDGHLGLTDWLSQSSDPQCFVRHTLGSSCLAVKFLQHKLIECTHAFLERNNHCSNYIAYYFFYYIMNIACDTEHRTQVLLRAWFLK